MRPLPRRAGLIALGTLAALLLLAPVAYAFDARGHEGRALRGVRIAGTDVGGMSRSEVEAVVEDVAKRYREAEVEVDAPGGGFTAPAAELGLEVERAATVNAAMAEGRRGGALERFGGWVTSFTGTRRAPVRVTVSPSAVHATVAVEDTERTAPKEPSIKAVKGGFEAVEGAPGKGIDPRAVVAALPDAAADGLPIRVRVGRGEVEPRFTLAEAEELARQADELVDGPLKVRAGEATGTVSADALRGWLRAETTGDVLSLSVDAEAAAKDLAKALPEAGDEPQNATFAVEGGSVVIRPGKVGTRCCGEDGGLAAGKALLDGTAGTERTVSVPLQRAEPQLTADEAADLGIKEQIGSFTTRYPAGQARVRNIHRISDLTRGYVIEPGKTFSVNEFVGRRTAAKGFVAGGVIEDGRFTEDIGGGISQYATTLFNAAFFGGLDLVEYQSHSLYISRYPYGREATLSYPKPDLKIRNPTPHGVLIWPTYTSSSITVSLWSTKWATGEQTGQTSSPRGPCTRVVTERTRTFVADGRKEVDRVSALYRPEEGVDCS